MAVMAGFHPVEIDAACKVSGLESSGIPTGSLRFIYQSFHQLCPVTLYTLILTFEVFGTS